MLLQFLLAQSTAPSRGFFMLRGFNQSGGQINLPPSATQGFFQLMPQCTGNVLSTATGERLCTLCDFLVLIDNIVKLLAKIAPIIAVTLIIWGAFVIITSGGSSGRLGQGRTIITRAVVGLLIVLGAWLIVSTTFLVLTGSDRYYGSRAPWNRVTCF